MGAYQIGSDERYTTQETFDWCLAKTGVRSFDLDPAACAESFWAARWYSADQNGLIQPWFGHIFLNPPYSDIEPWLDRAWRAVTLWTPHDCALSVSVLIPATKTEQKWWQKLVEPFRDLPANGILRTYFQPTRAAFAYPGSGGVGQKGSRFGCVLLVFRRLVP